MKSDHPNHSEQAFRRYETNIAQIISNYPKPTVFYPANKATFAGRMRDAVRSIKLNGWTSELFTTQKATKVFSILDNNSPFIFSMIKEGVYCGPKKKQALKVASSPLGELADADLKNDDEVFKAIITLKEKGYLPEPITFSTLSDEQKIAISHNPFLEFIEPNVVI